jgi:hypothetical protein
MNAAPKPAEKCEARYYIGELKLLAGDAVAAREMFERAAETCPPEFAERLRAERQLERLAQ